MDINRELISATLYNFWDRRISLKILSKLEFLDSILELFFISKWSIKFPQLQSLPKVVDENHDVNVDTRCDRPALSTSFIHNGTACSGWQQETPQLPFRASSSLNRFDAHCRIIENGQFASPWESPTLLSGFLFLSSRFLPSRS